MDQPAAVTPSPAKLLYEQQHITDDRSAPVIAANVACVTLAFIAVCLRFISRRMSKIAYKADDWLSISALVRHTVVLYLLLLIPVLLLVLYSLCHDMPLTWYVVLLCHHSPQLEQSTS
jgi:hypothetical protein